MDTTMIDTDNTSSDSQSNLLNSDEELREARRNYREYKAEMYKADEEELLDEEKNIGNADITQVDGTKADGNDEIGDADGNDKDATKAENEADYMAYYERNEKEVGIENEKEVGAKNEKKRLVQKMIVMKMLQVIQKTLTGNVSMQIVMCYNPIYKQ